MQFIDNYPLKNITTLQIGGPAKKFVEVKTQEELIEAITFSKQNNLEYLIIGGGSNLLVADEGVNKLIIKNEITGITTSGSHLEGARLNVKSGTVLQDLVDYSIQHGLPGLQKLTGIPGTVGGAVFGNAGAYGQTISDNIISVVILNPFQDLQTLPKKECNFNYRDSIFKQTKNPILEILLRLDTKNAIVQNVVSLLQKEADEVLEKRLIKYPKGIKCPGSFFKNIVASTLPKEILEKIPQEKIIYGKLPAGSLLEEVGAKGDSLEGIYIADYHANLFINSGSGSAKTFYDLAKKYADKVYGKFGIKLEPEVQLINLPPIL